VLLVPVGAVLLLTAVFLVARGTSSGQVLEKKGIRRS